MVKSVSPKSSQTRPPDLRVSPLPESHLSGVRRGSIWERTNGPHRGQLRRIVAATQANVRIEPYGPGRRHHGEQRWTEPLADFGRNHRFVNG